MERLAIEVSAVAAMLDFSEHLKQPKWHLLYYILPCGPEIELHFTLRSTVSEIMAIEVSAVAAILDFSEISKWPKWLFGQLI